MFLLRNRKCERNVAYNGMIGLWTNCNSLSTHSFRNGYSHLRKCLNERKAVGAVGARSMGTADYAKSKEPEGKYIGNDLPTESKVVICGGGVMGAAVAYHLALMGQGPNTVILEQGRLVSAEIELDW